MLNRNMIKKLIISIATVLCLTGLILFIFQDNMTEICLSLQDLSLFHILCLAMVGICYQMLDALAQYYLIKNIAPSFCYHQAIEISYLGVFGQVALFSAGSFPIQAFYLHHYGIEVGHTVGIKTLNYVIHKTSIVIFATIMLFIGHKWIFQTIPDIHWYLLAGYIICLTIIIVCLLLCTWSKAHKAAIWLLKKLPDQGKWASAAHKLQRQLDGMYEETTTCVKDKKNLLLVLMVNFVKLSVFCAVPYICTIILGESTIGITQSETLTSLMLLLSGAVPNVAGLGPIEIMFFLLYKPFLGEVPTSSALLLFRIATYYFPFVVSVAVFFIMQRRLLSVDKTKEDM